MEENKVIVISAMIGGGKTSLAHLISEKFGGVVFEEKIDSPLLKKLYEDDKEKQLEERTAFLLQLDFLANRYDSIRKALVTGENPSLNILDRSIYEDSYFLDVLFERGEINEEEKRVYYLLIESMMKDIHSLPKKSPDLNIYLKGSFETFIHRIQKRSRGFELAKETEEYFYHLWKGYDSWLEKQYIYSPTLIIDIDKFDYVENEVDQLKVLSMIENKLIELEILK